jgi:sulfide:quinone oxidoreductase
MEALAAQGVKTIISNRPDNEQPGQVSAAEAKALAESLGMSYHHIPLPGPGALTPELVDRFLEALEESAKPALAHCASGRRSSLLWAAARVRGGLMSPATAIGSAREKGVDLSPFAALLEGIGRF